MTAAAPVIRLIIPGDPKAKARPRFRAGQGGFTDARTREAETLLRSAFRQEYPGWEPLTGRLRLTAVFHRRTRHRVDVDNLLKLAKDALNGVAWVDDEQIAHAEALRVYGAAADARTEITVWTITEGGTTS